MRQFVTGVCVASTYVDQDSERRHDAVTVNSVTSLSLDPPLIALCLRHESRFLARIRSSARWAVSILSADHESIAEAFAQDQDKRAWAVKTMLGEPGPATGALIVKGPGWMECELDRSIAVGDHTMVIGEVRSTGVGDADSPLIFLEGRFRSLETVQS
ncbi:flavin reductase family protein [Glycomyces xiaoerkulensis]|uniref:flavin reductase family protein n=1 Tax=Glycomyces xiaoerkulensis TaxID=2038139 RepID=UPI0018E421AE|nr:flavin reductase family protein [Glycomyces xiaoerkulensis]